MKRNLYFRKYRPTKIIFKQESSFWATLSSIILAISTLALVFITLSYALSTYKMTNAMKEQTSIMQKDFELSLRPWISIHKIDKKEQGEDIAFYYTLTNTGKLPAIITFVEIKSLSNKPNLSKTLYKKKTSAVLSPGGFYTHQLFNFSKNKDMNLARINLFVEYKSASHNESKYKTSYILKNNPVKDITFQIESSNME